MGHRKIMATPIPNVAEGATMVDDIGADRMRDLQKFAELGRLSATLLHEISNPLTAAILHLELHHDQDSPNIRQAKRNIQILQKYVDAARQQLRYESSPTNFYLRPQLSQIRRVLTPLARRRGVRLRFELDSNYRIFGDPVKFQQIISNLIANAIYSYATIPPSTRQKVVSITITAKNQWIIIKVADVGIGITQDEMSKLFEPFFSTKVRDGDGLGIGLTVVKQYVENDFHGSISVKSTPLKGTIFTTKLRLTPRYMRRIIG